MRSGAKPVRSGRWQIMNVSPFQMRAATTSVIKTFPHKQDGSFFKPTKPCDFYRLLQDNCSILRFKTQWIIFRKAPQRPPALPSLRPNFQSPSIAAAHPKTKGALSFKIFSKTHPRHTDGPVVFCFRGGKGEKGTAQLCPAPFSTLSVSLPPLVLQGQQLANFFARSSRYPCCCRFK